VVLTEDLKEPVTADMYMAQVLQELTAADARHQLSIHTDLRQQIHHLGRVSGLAALLLVDTLSADLEQTTDLAQAESFRSGAFDGAVSGFFFVARADCSS
jgi:hypothetical protein